MNTFYWFYWYFLNSTLTLSDGRTHSISGLFSSVPSLWVTQVVTGPALTAGNYFALWSHVSLLHSAGVCQAHNIYWYDSGLIIFYVFISICGLFIFCIYSYFWIFMQRFLFCIVFIFFSSPQMICGFCASVCAAGPPPVRTRLVGKLLPGAGAWPRWPRAPTLLCSCQVQWMLILPQFV